MARAVRSGSRADTVVLLGCAAVALIITVLPAAPREALAGGLRRTVVAPLISLQAQAERARSAFVVRDVAAIRIDSLTLRTTQLAELEQENLRLRRLIGLGRQLSWGFVPAEAIHGRNLGDEHSILLTAGARAGVEPNSAVVAPDGLVGVITRVDPGTSQAILWTHPDFRVSAYAGSGTAFGIVAPHLGEGPDRYLLELRGVALRENLAPGTPVRSAGLGSVIPRGIPIGTIETEIKTSEVWSRTYLVRSAVVPHDVSNVMVLMPQRVSDDLTSIWATPGADSAAARVRAAGDSLAADSVRRELTRRPPPRDTLPPDSSRATETGA